MQMVELHSRRWYSQVPLSRHLAKKACFLRGNVNGRNSWPTWEVRQDPQKHLIFKFSFPWIEYETNFRKRNVKIKMIFFSHCVISLITFGLINSLNRCFVLLACFTFPPVIFFRAISAVSCPFPECSWAGVMKGRRWVQPSPAHGYFPFRPSGHLFNTDGSLNSRRWGKCFHQKNK